MTAQALAAEAAAVLADRTGVAHHDIALVLGSGWGGAAELIGEEVASVEASRHSGLHAHVGRRAPLDVPLASHRPTASRVLVLGARQHFYQSRDAAKVAHAVRMAAAAGCTQLVRDERLRLDPPRGRPRLRGAAVRPHQLHRRRPRSRARPLCPGRRRTPRACGTWRAPIDPDLLEGVYIAVHRPPIRDPRRGEDGDRSGAPTSWACRRRSRSIAAREAGMEVLGLSLVTNLGRGHRRASTSITKRCSTRARPPRPRISRLLADIVGKM